MGEAGLGQQEEKPYPHHCRLRVLGGDHHCRLTCCPSGVWRRLCQLTHLLATELGHIVLPHGAEQRLVVILQPWK